MTTALPLPEDRAGMPPSGLPDATDLPAGLGFAAAVVEALAGFSAATSRAGLSARNPLKAAWRTTPAPVHPANSISATSSGFTQWTVEPCFGAPGPVKGFCLAAMDFNLV